MSCGPLIASAKAAGLGEKPWDWSSGSLMFGVTLGPRQRRVKLRGSSFFRWCGSSAKRRQQPSSVTRVRACAVASDQLPAP